MAPRLKRERGCGCRNLAKSFIAFFWFYRNFCFPSRFFKPRWSIAFFSCTRVSQVHINSLYTHIYIYYVSRLTINLARNNVYSVQSSSLCHMFKRHHLPFTSHSRRAPCCNSSFNEAGRPSLGCSSAWPFLHTSIYISTPKEGIVSGIDKYILNLVNYSTILGSDLNRNHHLVIYDFNLPAFSSGRTMKNT